MSENKLVGSSISMAVELHFRTEIIDASPRFT